MTPIPSNSSAKIAVLALCLSAARLNASQGVEVLFYRNIYSPTLNNLEEIYERREPFCTYVVPDFRSQDFLGRKLRGDNHNYSHLYAYVMRSVLTPEEGGLYNFRANIPCRLYISSDASEKNCVMHEMTEFGNISEILSVKPVELKAGKNYFIKAFVLPKTVYAKSSAVGIQFSLKWSVKGKDVGGIDDQGAVSTDAEAFAVLAAEIAAVAPKVSSVPRDIPASCLEVPSQTEDLRFVQRHEKIAPYSAYCGEEPDSLSWEIFGMEPAFVRHFLDWAHTNLSPVKSESVSGEAVCVRFCAGDFVTGSDKWVASVDKDGVKYLAGPGSHNFRDACQVDIEIPQDGRYRLWTRYWHTAGKNETFNLKVVPSRTEKIADDDTDVLFPSFEQCFARSNPHPGRTADPTPQIESVPTPPNGYLWESSHRTCFMRKGKYTLHFVGGQYPNRPKLKITDILFTCDPMFDPTGKDIPYGLSMQPLSEEVTDAFYANRPGATRFDDASPENQKMWLEWREAVYEKLENSELTDYVWGYLATLNSFDAESNLIGRVPEIRAQKDLDARNGDVHKFAGSNFVEQAGWNFSEFYAKSYNCTGNITSPKTPDRETYLDLDIKTSGKYLLAMTYYGWGGTVNVSVGTPEQIDIYGSIILGSKGGANNWVRSPRMDLPTGPVRITMKSCGGDNRAICVVNRGILTYCHDFMPEREIDYPDGEKVGDEEIGFWRSPDPWAGFTRYSAPGVAYYNQYAPLKWIAVSNEEINCVEYDVSALQGEVRSELLMIRNNTDKPIVMEPQAESELPVGIRVVTSVISADGRWSPMLLLRRNTIVAPPQQNTGLWLTIDGRGAKYGKYPIRVSFADKTVTFNVTIAETLEGTLAPYLYPYAEPYPRASSYEAFKDLGFNVTRFNGMSRRVMQKYGFKHLVGLPGDAKTDEGVRKAIAWADKLGLKPGEYCWYLIDEPSPGDIPLWTEMADRIKRIDPEQSIWCNLSGFLPSVNDAPAYMSIMDRWDVACPFYTQLGLKKEGFEEYHSKLCAAGKQIRLLYHTLDMGTTEKLLWAPHELLEVGRTAANPEYNRNGWAIFSMIFGKPFDDIYTDNQDEAISMYPGSFGTTIQTRNTEAMREAAQRWRKAKKRAAAKEKSSL